MMKMNGSTMIDPAVVACRAAQLAAPHSKLSFPSHTIIAPPCGNRLQAAHFAAAACLHAQLRIRLRYHWRQVL